jgi:hypothetical protein
LAWYDPSWPYPQKITIDHTLVDGADIVVTAGDGTTRPKRELVTYDAMAGELELYVRIPSLSSVTDTDIYIYYGNSGRGRGQ